MKICLPTTTGFLLCATLLASCAVQPERVRQLESATQQSEKPGPAGGVPVTTAIRRERAADPDNIGLPTRETEIDRTGIRIVYKTPDQFCNGTARLIAVDRFIMKRAGTPLQRVLEGNDGVAIIDAITRAIYASEIASEAAAADAGTRTCLRHFSRGNPKG